MFPQSGFATPVGSAQAAFDPHCPVMVLANGATCVVRPGVTVAGTAGAAAAGSGAANGSAGASGQQHGGPPGGGDPHRGSQGGDRGRGGDGGRPPRHPHPASTPEKRATRGGPGGDGDGGGGDGAGGHDDDMDARSVRSEDSAALGPHPGGRRVTIDLFTIQKFPQIGDFKRWQASVVDEVVGAWHGNIDEIFEWMNFIEEPRTTMDMLATTGDKFMRMDAKLLTAISKVATGELGRELTQAASEEKDLHKRLLKGRQMLFLSYQYYEISEDKSVTYNITDLTRLIWLGDKRIADFLVSWNTVVGGMRGQLGEAPIHQWFYEQVKKSTVLKEEVAHYDRVDSGHPHKTYKWLMGAVRKYVMVRRRDHNREKNVERAFTGAAPGGPAAPAKSEGKGHDKDVKQCTLCGRKGTRKRSVTPRRRPGRSTVLPKEPGRSLIGRSPLPIPRERARARTKRVVRAATRLQLLRR